MKKIIAIVAGLMLGAGILVSPPAHASSKKNDNLYVKIIRNEAPELKRVGRTQLIKGAKTTCRYLRAGGGILDAVEMALNAGIRRSTAMALVAGAVVFYCPEQEGNY
jgi:hypothetical protein